MAELNWTYTDDALPPVDCANVFPYIGRFTGRAFAPVLFSSMGEPSAVAGRYFSPVNRSKAVFVSLQGKIYRADEVYAWAPAPVSAPRRPGKER